MAKISFGAIVDNARGKTGGIVFTKTRSGSNIRIRVKPKNPRSSAQSSRRADLTAASRAYKGLGATDLALWAAYAAGITKHQSVSGQAYQPTGIDVFTSLASKFLQITPGGAIPVTPPTSPFSGDPSTVAAVGGSGSVTFTASADAQSGNTVEMLLQPLKSANRVPTPRGYRSRAFSIVAHGTPVVISGLTPGSYVPAYKSEVIATGQQSGLFVLPTVVVT